jgi:hypothetical protein
VRLTAVEGEKRTDCDSPRIGRYSHRSVWGRTRCIAAFYFSSTIVDDSKTYGTIGVTCTLVTWFIAMGAVLTPGAVVGTVWPKRRSHSTEGQASAANAVTESQAPKNPGVFPECSAPGTRPKTVADRQS